MNVGVSPGDIVYMTRRWRSGVTSLGVYLITSISSWVVSYLYLHVRTDGHSAGFWAGSMPEELARGAFHGEKVIRYP